MSCYDSVQVDLQRADAKRFVEGRYTLHVTADGVETIATCAVPAVTSSVVGCGGTEKLSITVDGSHIFVELRDRPKTVSLTLEMAGKRLAETSFTPSYGEITPGGDGCLPACQRASTTVPVTS